jgi:DNA sulfur modification protein DndB
MTPDYCSFVALRGCQSEHDYYLIQCPLRLLSHLFRCGEADLPITLPSNCSLNNEHATALTGSLTTHPETYILTPLVAAMDCPIMFKPLINDLPELGHLQIPDTASLTLYDGQEQCRVIQHALATSPAMGDATIPVMLLSNLEFTHSLSGYANFRRTTTRYTQSQRVLHDERPLATLVRQLVVEVPLFQGLTELEKTTISNRSTALFTLSAIYQATKALLGVGPSETISSDQMKIAHRFWGELSQHIPEWQQAIKREIAPSFLRQHFVHVHTVTLIAIGMAGHDLINTWPDNWIGMLHILGNLDWSRDNTGLWEGRAMLHGRMRKTHDSIKLTAIVLRQNLGLPLSERE